VSHSLRQPKPLLRRLLALLVVAVAVADVAIFMVVAHARTLTHVKLSIAGDEEVVQVFVGCKLAYVYQGRGQAVETPDLGWIAKSDILTFQVRSLQALGYYQLAFSHDAHTVQVQARGMPSEHVLQAEDRVIYKSSFVAATGAPLGKLGCQKDASPLLALAESPSSHGRWDRGPQTAFAAASALEPIVPRALAVVGAVFLIGAAVLGRAKQGHGPIARIVFAVVDVVLAMSSLVAQDFALAAALCIVAGIGSLVAVLYWLLVEDLRRIAARWIAREPPRKQFDLAA
jgi:hypothetical protein